VFIYAKICQATVALCDNDRRLILEGIARSSVAHALDQHIRCLHDYCPYLSKAAVAVDSSGVIDSQSGDEDLDPSEV
jgi:hypothetical protein